LQNRTKKVTFRVTPSEKEHLKIESGKAGLPVEPFLRRLVLGVDLQPRPPAELTEILRQLTAIGNNINQIARVANSAGKVHQADLEYIKTLQSMIWQKIKLL
jgi:hypothetical protein